MESWSSFYYSAHGVQSPRYSFSTRSFIDIWAINHARNRSKKPDCAWQPANLSTGRRNLRLNTLCPFIMVEVRWTETRAVLGKSDFLHYRMNRRFGQSNTNRDIMMGFWLLGSGGAVKVALSLTATRDPERAIIFKNMHKKESGGTASSHTVFPARGSS